MSDDVKKHPVCYVLVRKDLPKTRQGIDAAHAAQECVRVAPVDKRTAIRWLWVENETELLEYAKRLVAKNFDHDVVYEPDEPYAGQAMSLGVTPLVDLDNYGHNNPPSDMPCTRTPADHEGSCAYPPIDWK